MERLRRATGLSPADFLACVKDKALFDGVNATRDSAAERFGLNSTPTFFVNGHKLDGEAALPAFDAALAAPAEIGRFRTGFSAAGLDRRGALWRLAAEIRVG